MNVTVTDILLIGIGAIQALALFILADLRARIVRLENLILESRASAP